MNVLKFGGTSVGSPQRIRNLTQIIPTSEPVLLVLSAMSGTTNALISIATHAEKGKTRMAQYELQVLEAEYSSVVDELFHTDMYKNSGRELVNDLFIIVSHNLHGEVGKKEINAIVATGELLSTGLFQLYLTSVGQKSAYLPALSFMRTNEDGEPDYPYISKALSRQLDAFPEINIFITQGFICLNAHHEVDNLGRGGSDYSAAILGNVLNAAEVQIWTDIDGIHNNDPRFVKETTPVRELSYDEAAELAYFGAKILHPSTIHPCSRKGIPVLLKNTLNPSDPGTRITSRCNEAGIKAVAAKDGITAIKIRSSRMLMAHGFLKKVFEVFDEFKTPVDMIATSEVAISLTIDNPQYLESIVQTLKQFSSVEVDTDQSIICVVGDFVAEKPGCALNILRKLKHIPIRMISYGGSRHNISLLVNSHLKVEALRAIQTIVNEYATVAT